MKKLDNKSCFFLKQVELQLVFIMMEDNKDVFTSSPLATQK